GGFVISTSVPGGSWSNRDVVLTTVVIAGTLDHGGGGLTRCELSCDGVATTTLLGETCSIDHILCSENQKNQIADINTH
ncbi:hypothetical protein M8C21_023503, partial [Ambrosia artemisiifolia]